jgi:hypothetical protein
MADGVVILEQGLNFYATGISDERSQHIPGKENRHENHRNIVSCVRTGLFVVLLPALLLLAACATQQTTAARTGAAEQALAAKALEDEAFAIGTDAYVYGYPLITMEMTRRVVTNVVKPEGARAPMGQLMRMREYPTAAFRDVTAPNADTLYTKGWMDVGKEPWVLSIPDAKGRYYLMPMLDGWTEVFQVPGKRTTGTKAQKYLVTGPGWKGEAPKGLDVYKSSTSVVWLLGRIYCTGTPQDYAEVHAMQDKVSITPLSAYGKPYAAPEGKVDPNEYRHEDCRARAGA